MTLRRLCLLALIASILPSAAMAEEDLILRRLRYDPQYEFKILEAAQKSVVVKNNPCPSASFVVDDHPVTLQPLELDDNAQLIAGMWKQSVAMEGCGAKHTLNVWGSVDKATHGMKLQPILPGVTLADPLLQRDAIPYAVTAVRSRQKTCDTGYVYDTRFVSLAGTALPGAKGPPWDEVWTLIYCDIKAEVTLHFIPDSTGTTISVRGSETVITPVQ